VTEGPNRWMCLRSITRSQQQPWMSLRRRNAVGHPGAAQHHGQTASEQQAPSTLVSSHGHGVDYLQPVMAAGVLLRSVHTGAPDCLLCLASAHSWPPELWRSARRCQVVGHPGANRYHCGRCSTSGSKPALICTQKGFMQGHCQGHACLNHVGGVFVSCQGRTWFAEAPGQV
jgi:hypothetical protein